MLCAALYGWDRQCNRQSVPVTRITELLALAVYIADYLKPGSFI